MATAIDSLSVGCDEVPYCTICPSSKGLNEAEHYCVECAQYTCTACNVDHDKWPANKKHQVVPASEGIQFTGQKLKETCRIHEGKLVDSYCQLHDEVCCSTCGILHHRSCLITHVKSLAKGIRNTNEYKSVLASSEKILKKLKEAKIEAEKEQSSIDAELSSDTDKVKEGRAKIQEHFDDLEENSITQIAATYGKRQDQINNKITLLDALISPVTDVQNGLTDANESDEAIFVKVKRGKKVNHDTTVPPADSTDKKGTVFEFDPTVVDRVTDFQSFGKFLHPNRLYSVQLLGNFNVRLPSDSNECGIHGSLLMDDGSILLVDRANHKLKKLDASNKLVDHCEIPGKPYGVCKIDNTKSVAVSVFAEKKIQFVSVNGEKLSLASSFTVKSACRGIAFKDGELYVSCAGVGQEGPGHIEVYDVCGTFLRTFGQGHLGIPIHIAFGVCQKDSDTLYVTDSGIREIAHFYKNGQFITKISMPSLDDVKGMCVVHSTMLFVCGRRSHNVMQYNLIDGQCNHLVGSESDVTRPCSVLFDRQTSRLILTMYNNSIKVFSVTYTTK